jgi:hypothetical protein
MGDRCLSEGEGSAVGISASAFRNMLRVEEEVPKTNDAARSDV